MEEKRARQKAKAAMAEDIELTPQMSARDAFGEIVHECLRQYQANAALLKKGHSVEVLHQARVALRRLRSLLSAFRPVLRRGARQRLNDELRWLTGEYGAVRDIDVLLPLLKGKQLRMAKDMRDERFGHLLRTLSGHRASDLPDALVQWVDAENPIRKSKCGVDVGGCARQAFDTLFGQLKRTDPDLASLSADERHKLRKQVKKLRYATGFFASLYEKGRPHKRRSLFMDDLKLLQDRLGELNDMAVRPVLIQELGLAVQFAASEGDHDALLKEAGAALAGLVGCKPFWR